MTAFNPSGFVAALLAGWVLTACGSRSGEVRSAPEPVRELIRRGLAKDPADRPTGAAAFVEEVEAVAARAYGPDWEQRGILALAALAGVAPRRLPVVALEADAVADAAHAQRGRLHAVHPVTLEGTERNR
jgi:hypothetical protein